MKRGIIMKLTSKTFTQSFTDAKMRGQTAMQHARVVVPSSKQYGYVFVAILVLAISFIGGWLGAGSRTNSVSTATITQQRTILKNEANVISDIASTVGPSVVSVQVTSQATSVNPYAALFGTGTQESQSAGTGIILSAGGLIMTNRHVVPIGTTSVSVTLSDGTTLDDVTVLGRTGANDSLDVAFLKVGDKKGKTLTPAKLGDSSLVKVGDAVVAIGNTLGQFQNTVTSGIISGYGRSLQASDSSGAGSEMLDDMFQTDAAINEGNSGGPLVNLAGEVIGMNTAVASGAQTVGFAIPINNLMGIIKSVQSTGKLERPYAGVHYVMLTDDIAKQYNLHVTRGAYVPNVAGAVISGGPAEKAGIQGGDVITKIGEVNIKEGASVSSALSKYRVGDDVEITLVRGSDTKTVVLHLEAAPSN